MKQTIKKRLLNIALCLCMVMIMLPMTAMADGESTSKIYWGVTTNAQNSTVTLNISSQPLAGTDQCKNGSFDKDHAYAYQNYPAWYDYATDITTVVIGSSEDIVAPKSTAFWFYGLANATNIDMTGLDTSNTISMEAMFQECNSLITLDVSHFDTSNVINMGYMFAGCKKVENLDVSHFNTTKTTAMLSMFCECNALLSVDVSKFNTSGVTSMRKMFCGCSNLTQLDISGFDTSKVTTFEDMFFYCTKVEYLNVSKFNTENLISSRRTFSGCNSVKYLDLSNWYTSKITNKTEFLYAPAATIYLADIAIATSGTFVAGKTTLAITNGGTFADDTTFTAGTLTTPKKTGYSFEGWYDNANLIGDKVTTVTAGSTYYAKWTELPITFIDKTGENAFTYDGTSKTLTATLVGNTDAAFTYTYAKRNVDGTSYAEATSTAPTNAGYYKVVASITGSDRTTTAYMEIKPATISATSKNVYVSQGDTTTQQIDLNTLATTPSLTQIGDANYAIESTQDSNNILNGAATIVDGKLQFKLKEVVDTQHTASFVINITSAFGNYNPIQTTVVVKITADTVKPTMTATPVSDASTIIGLNNKISIAFSKKMMGTPYIAVSGGNGTANAILSADGLSMMITPNNLDNGKVYTFTINGLTDVAGNSLVENTLTYTTIKLAEISGTAVPTITGDDTIITGNNDAIPDNITIDYTSQVNTQNKTTLKDASNLPGDYTATDIFFELTLKVNGVPVENAGLNRPISVTIPYALQSNTTYKIAHIKADGTVEILDATADLSAQTLTFSVTSFSPFMVLSKYSKHVSSEEPVNQTPTNTDNSSDENGTYIPSKDKNVDIPKTGDSSNIYLLVVLLFISCGTATMFGIANKRKKYKLK